MAGKNFKTTITQMVNKPFGDWFFKKEELFLELRHVKKSTFFLSSSLLIVIGWGEWVCHAKPFSRKTKNW